MRASESDFYRDVGGNLRLARELAGKSQTAVAKYLNVSFQQIQKYENGSNRIPMDKFIALSDYLRVSPTALLQGHAAQGANDAESASFFDQMQDREFRELLGVWSRIEDRKLRTETLMFLKALAASQQRQEKKAP